jgi:hypothetical protein
MDPKDPLRAVLDVCDLAISWCACLTLQKRTFGDEQFFAKRTSRNEQFFAKRISLHLVVVIVVVVSHR